MHTMDTEQLRRFSFRLNKISPTPVTSTPRCKFREFTAVTVGHFVLVFGGKRYEKHASFYLPASICIFCCKSRKWTMSRLKIPFYLPGRYQHCATLVDDCMYAFCRVDYNGSRKYGLWRFDIVLFEWQKVASVEEIRGIGRTQATLEYLAESKELLVIGGARVRKPHLSDCLAVYSVGASRWHVPRIKGSTPLQRHGHDSCVCGKNNVAIYGGVRYEALLNDIFILKKAVSGEVYTWSQPVPRSSFAGGRRGAVFSAGKVYVFGGLSDRLSIFDLSKGIWLKNVGLQGKGDPAGNCMVRANQQMYLFGGQERLPLDKQTFELYEL